MKTITVIGATGLQGSSVVAAFSESWKVRAVTRNPQSDKAQSLLSLSPNVELVKADTGDKESLVQAFRGSNVIYAVTDYWAPFASEDRQKHATGPDPSDSLRRWAHDEEIRHGRNLADAAAVTLASSTGADGGLERFVWSGEPSPVEISGNDKKYQKIYHFESKAAITAYIRETHPSLAARMNVIYVAFYCSNFLRMHVMWPARREDGSFVVQRLSGDERLPFVITEEDTGPMVYAMVHKAAPGETLLAYTAMVSWPEMTKLWAAATGQKAEFQRVDTEEIRRHFPLEGDELLSAAYAAEYGFAGPEGSFITPENLGFSYDKGRLQKWMERQDWTAVLSAPARQS